MRELRLLLAVILVVTGLGFLAPQTAHAASLPGGKAHFVLSFMAYRAQSSTGPSSAFNRVSEITFNTNGTLNERYWSWSAQMAPSKNNAMANSVRVGTTKGCYKDCGVWAPVSFDTAGKTRTGTWRQTTISGKPYAVIYWDATGIRETYAINTKNPKLTELIMSSSSHANVVEQWGRAYGSNYRGPGVKPQAIPNVALHAPASMGGKNLHSKRWGAKTAKHDAQSFYLGMFSKCASTSGCLVSGATKGSKWLQYMHFQPGTRKVTWFNMVIGPQNTRNYYDCINKGVGGHQWAMLQVIDDAGAFQGFVGSEASLYGRTDPANYVAMIAALR